jgi:hypothetical protein
LLQKERGRERDRERERERERERQDNFVTVIYGSVGELKMCY